jgi:adenosylmethionine-8-amino-7-oxononanoate aminotransferase
MENILSGLSGVLCPPFIIEPAQIERMVDLLADAISQQA